MAIPETAAMNSAAPTPMEVAAVDPKKAAADLKIAVWLERLDNVFVLAKINPSRLDRFLYQAVGSGPVEAVEAAIKMGAEICLLDDVGETALHLAMRIGDLAKVALLVNNFSNFCTRDFDNRTVLDIYKTSTEYDHVKLLKEAAKNKSTLTKRLDPNFRN